VPKAQKLILIQFLARLRAKNWIRLRFLCLREASCKVRQNNFRKGLSKKENFGQPFTTIALPKALKSSFNAVIGPQTGQ
jgi:hypothetical protein